jgi:hypothetical protein
MMSIISFTEQRIILSHILDAMEKLMRYGSVHHYDLDFSIVGL